MGILLLNGHPSEVGTFGALGDAMVKKGLREKIPGTFVPENFLAGP